MRAAFDRPPPRAFGGSGICGGRLAEPADLVDSRLEALRERVVFRHELLDHARPPLRLAPPPRARGRKVVGELRRPRALGPQRVDERADVAPQEAVRDRAGRRRRHLEPPEALQGDR